MKMNAQKQEYLWAPLAEGGVILFAGLIGMLIGKPIVFSSLGPTAFEQVEKPTSPGAHPYNVVVGHLIGILAGFAGLALSHAWQAPAVLSTHLLAWPRMWAAVFAVAITTLWNLLAKASQPAACATTLLVALGSFQTFHRALILMLGIIAIVVVGEPLQHLRLHFGPPPAS